MGDQYWMLTNWNRSPNEAVKVSALQRMLEYYGPEQVAIIGDACQEFSARFIDVIGSAVLDKPDEEPHQYELDQFFAVDVGKQAFMIKATGTQQAFCLFTEVLLDALEGDAPESAFEQIGADRVVTSQSLARHLKSTVTREAGRYGERMIPHLRPGFFTDRAYARMPPSVNPREAVRGPRNPEQDQEGEKEFPGSPTVDLPPRRRTVERFSLTKPDLATPDLGTQGEELDQARARRRDEFAGEVGLATVRGSFDSGAGLIVSGAKVVRVEASFGEPFQAEENPNWRGIQLKDTSSLGWSDALVTLEDGRICSVCVVQGFVAALHVLGDGTSISLFHRAIGAGDSVGTAMAIDMLAELHSGLASFERILEMAVSLRNGKHEVITIGCIAAQFYDAIRDVDSLRQMASFYAQHNQPAPLDIVLYGGGTISEEAGRLFVRIPEVQAREPRTLAEENQRFTFCPTPAFVRHPIAGRVPWMRQAWSAVETAVCDDSARGWREDALAAMEYLRPGDFTNVTPAGREALAKLAGVGRQRHRQLRMT